MASLKAKFGRRVTYHYHEFNRPETAPVNRDFRIDAHPMIFILDRKGQLVRYWRGVVSLDDLVRTLQPLLPKRL